MKTREQAKAEVVASIRKVYNEERKDNAVFTAKMVGGKIVKMYHPKYVTYLENVIADMTLDGMFNAKAQTTQAEVRLEKRETKKDLDRQVRQGKKK